MGGNTGMNCTTEGRTVTTPVKGVNEITVGTKSAEAPRRLVYGRAKVGGVIVYAETTGATNQNLHLVIVFCDGPVEEIESIYFGDEAVTLDSGGLGTGKWANRVAVNFHLGATDQDADADLVANSTSLKWTDAHRLRGVAYAYLKLTNWDYGTRDPHPEIFERAPNVSAIIKGCNDITDPRTGLTAYNTNPALALNHFRLRKGKTALSSATLTAAANVCDYVVSGRNRYTVGGIIESSASIEDVQRQFLASMNGTLAEIAGRFLLYVGGPPAAVNTVTWDHVREAPILTRTTGESETATAAYQGEETNWTNTNAQGDSEAERSLRLDLVDNEQQAQLIEKQTNEKKKPREIAELLLSPHHFNVTAGDSIIIDLYPMTTGTFEVEESELIISGLEIQTRIKATRHRESIYSDYATTERTAKTLSVSPRTVAAPTSNYASGSWGFPLTVTITAPGDAILRYSFSATPTSVSSGSAYYGSITIPSATTLYLAAFKTGWAPGTSSYVYS